MRGVPTSNIQPCRQPLLQPTLPSLTIRNLYCSTRSWSWGLLRAAREVSSTEGAGAPGSTCHRWWYCGCSLSHLHEDTQQPQATEIVRDLDEQQKQLAVLVNLRGMMHRLHSAHQQYTELLASL
jgi:hypothetical protein